MRRPTLQNRSAFLWLAVSLIALCALKPTDSDAAAEERRLYRIAKAQFGDGLYELSAASWKTFFEKFPASAHADEGRLLWAESLVRANKPAEAAKLLEDRLAAPPPIAERWRAGYLFWLAEAQLKLGEFKRAAERYSAMLQAHPQTPLRAAAFYGRAVACFKLGDVNGADESLRDARDLLRRQPAPAAAAAKTAHEELSRHLALLQAQVALAQEKFAEAAEALRDYLKQHPAHPSRHEAMLWLAEVLLRQGAPDETIEMLRAILGAPDADTPLKSEAWLRLGNALTLKRQWQEAADAFGECLKLAAASALRREALVRRAESLVAAANKPLAVEELREFSEKNQDDPLADDALLWAADLLFEARNPQLDPKILAEALKLYQSLPARFPQSPLAAAARHGAGLCLLALRRESDAVAEFTEAAKAQDARLAAESQLRLGDTLFMLKRFDEAAAAYGEYLKRFENGEQRDTALFQRGVSFAYAGKTTEAVASFEQLAAQSPPTALSEAAAFAVGRSQLMGGDFEGAQSAFEKFIQRFGQSSPLADEARLAIAQALYSRGSFAEARAKLEPLLTRATSEKHAARARYELAWSLYQSGETTAAQQQFEELLSKFPASDVAPEAAAWLADQAYRQRDLAKAQDRYAALAADYPASEWAEVALLTAARIAQERDKLADAFKLLDTLRQKYPASPLQNDAVFLQAELSARYQEFQNAILLFDIIIAKIPDSPLGIAALGRKGDCLQMLGNYAEAARAYRRLIEHSQADADALVEARYNLARCLEKLGRLDESLAQYAEVVYGWRVDPQDHSVREDLWFCRAAFHGADVAEKLNKPLVAIRLLEHVVEAGASLREEAAARARGIRLKTGNLR